MAAERDRPPAQNPETVTEPTNHEVNGVAVAPITNRLKVSNVSNSVASDETNEVSDVTDPDVACVSTTIGVGEKLPAVGVDTGETSMSIKVEGEVPGKKGNDAPSKPENSLTLATVVANGPVSGGGRETLTVRDTRTRLENVAPG